MLILLLLCRHVLLDSKNCVPLKIGMDVDKDLWDNGLSSRSGQISCHFVGDTPTFFPPMKEDPSVVSHQSPFYCKAKNNCSEIIGKYVDFDIAKTHIKIVSASSYNVAEGKSYAFQLIEAPQFFAYDFQCSPMGGISGFLSTEIRKGYLFINNVIFESSNAVTIKCVGMTSLGSVIDVPSFNLVKSTTEPSNIIQFPPPNVLYNSSDLINCFFNSIINTNTITKTSENGITTCKHGYKTGRFLTQNFGYKFTPMDDCLVTDSRKTCIFKCDFINTVTGLPFGNRVIWRVDGVLQRAVGTTLVINNKKTSGSVTCGTDMTDMPNLISSARIIYQNSVEFGGAMSAMSIPTDTTAMMKCSVIVNEVLAPKCHVEFYLNGILITNGQVYNILEETSTSGTLQVVTKNVEPNQTISGQYKCALSCPHFQIVYKSEDFNVVYAPEQTYPVHSNSINWMSIIVALVVLAISFVVIVVFIYFRKCRGSSYNIDRAEQQTRANLDMKGGNFQPLNPEPAVMNKYHSNMISENDSLDVYSGK